MSLCAVVGDHDAVRSACGMTMATIQSPGSSKLYISPVFRSIALGCEGRNTLGSAAERRYWVSTRAESGVVKTVRPQHCSLGGFSVRRLTLPVARSKTAAKE